MRPVDELPTRFERPPEFDLERIGATRARNSNKPVRSISSRCERRSTQSTASRCTGRLKFWRATPATASTRGLSRTRSGGLPSAGVGLERYDRRTARTAGLNRRTGTRSPRTPRALKRTASARFVSPALHAFSPYLQALRRSPAISRYRRDRKPKRRRRRSHERLGANGAGRRTRIVRSQDGTPRRRVHRRNHRRRAARNLDRTHGADVAVGAKGKDDGAVLFLFMQDHKVRIEVGYGLESTLTDAPAARIIADTIVPAMKRGDADDAVTDGASAMLAAIDPTYQTLPSTVSSDAGNSASDTVLEVVAGCCRSGVRNPRIHRVRRRDACLHGPQVRGPHSQ